MSNYVDPVEHARAARSFAGISQAVESERLVISFLKDSAFSKQMHHAYFTQQRMAGEARASYAAIFRSAFPEFPFYLELYPPAKMRETTALHHFWGKKGGEITRQYEALAAAALHETSERAMIMLTRLERLNGVYVVHNTGAPVVSANVLTIACETGGFLKLQPLADFWDEFADVRRAYFECWQV